MAREAPAGTEGSRGPHIVVGIRKQLSGPAALTAVFVLDPIECSVLTGVTQLAKQVETVGYVPIANAVKGEAVNAGAEAALRYSRAVIPHQDKVGVTVPGITPPDLHAPHVGKHPAGVELGAQGNVLKTAARRNSHRVERFLKGRVDLAAVLERRADRAGTEIDTVVIPVPRVISHDDRRRQDAGSGGHRELQRRGPAAAAQEGQATEEGQTPRIQGAAAAIDED